MFLYFFVLLVVPQVVCYHLKDTCTFYDDATCKDGRKDTKSGPFPDIQGEAHFCLETGSKLDVDAPKQSLRLIDYGFLNNYKGGSISIKSGGGKFLLQDRSQVSNYGKIYLDSSMFDIWYKSELLNFGEINFSKGSVLRLGEHSSMRVPPTGKLVLGPNCDMKIFTRAHMTLCHVFNDTTTKVQNFIMQNSSGLTLTQDANLVLVEGEIKLLENSYIDVGEQGYMEVNGDLRLSRNSGIYISKRADIRIGFADDVVMGEYNEDLDPTTSLLFGDENLKLYVEDQCSLSIKQGAHCTLKKSYYMKKSMVLDKTTTNDYFECSAMIKKDKYL